MTDEQKHELSNCLSEISKGTSNAGRLLGQADVAVQKLAGEEAELVSMNLDKLKVTLEEAEEVQLGKTAHPIKSQMAKQTCTFLGGGGGDVFLEVPQKTITSHEHVWGWMFSLS